MLPTSSNLLIVATEGMASRGLLRHPGAHLEQITRGEAADVRVGAGSTGEPADGEWSLAGQDQVDPSPHKARVVEKP